MLDLNLTLVIQMVLFLLFAGLMNAVFFRPVTKALEERRAFIANKHGQATRDLQQIQTLQQDYEARLKGARLEAQAAIQAAVGDAEGKRNALLASVKGELDQQIARAREEIRAERDSALAELSGDVHQLAALIARRVAGEAASVAASRTGSEA